METPLDDAPGARPRLPSWLKVRAPGGARYAAVKETLRGRTLHTVCEEARCPNIGECWNAGTATIMVLGDVCTRGCRFCAVAKGNPRGAVDSGEPRRVADAVASMGLRYVVLTMVDRDDLPDGGAHHVASCVQAIKGSTPHAIVEVLTGDFQGDEPALRTVAESGAEVLAHNVEVVRRLTPRVRDGRCEYDLSLAVLSAFRRLGPAGTVVKSSLMVGVGETDAEVSECMADLRGAGVEILTVGQYLRPTPRHLAVARFVPPGEFDRMAAEGMSLGFRHVAAGPLVRSSYRAEEGLALAAAERITARPAGQNGSAPCP